MNDQSTQPAGTDHKQSKLADHILQSSATMIGVCMTVISVSQLIPKHNVSRHVDELLAFDSLLFLVSALFSYFSFRNPERAFRLERLADTIFLFSIALMVLVGFIVAFELLID